MSHHPADRRSQELSSLQEWSSVSCFPLGEINQAYANYFSGISYLALLNQTDLPVFNVTFEPGCRNFWHIHHQGRQVLLVTAGRGWYLEEGCPARELHPGDTVYIAPGTKHWHGAARDSWFSHIAVAIPAQEASNEWLESVSEQEYQLLP